MCVLITSCRFFSFIADVGGGGLGFFDIVSIELCPEKVSFQREAEVFFACVLCCYVGLAMWEEVVISVRPFFEPHFLSRSSNINKKKTNRNLIFLTEQKFIFSYHRLGCLMRQVVSYNWLKLTSDRDSQWACVCVYAVCCLF